MRLLFTIYHLLVYLDINLVTVINRYFQNYYCSCYCYYQLCYYCYCTVYCTITVLYYYRLYLSVCSYWQFISLTDASCLYAFTAYTFHRHQLFCMHLLHIFYRHYCLYAFTAYLYILHTLAVYMLIHLTDYYTTFYWLFIHFTSAGNIYILQTLAVYMHLLAIFERFLLILCLNDYHDYLPPTTG